MRRSVLLVVAGASIAWRASPAFAQAATALDQLELAPPDDAFLVVPSAEDPGRVRPSFGVLVSGAHAPLVLASPDHATRSVVVERQVVLHAQASVGLFHRFTFDLDMPFTLQQNGDREGDPRFPSPDSASANDLRVGARFLPLLPRGAWPGLGLGLAVWFPTGDASLYSGAGTTRVASTINLSGETPRVDWGAFVEGRFTPAVYNQLVGSQVRFGAAAAVKFSVIRLGPEIGVDLGTDMNDGSIGVRTTTVETLIVARATAGPVQFTLGGGPGFGRAPGTPAFRGLAGVSVAFDALRDPPAGTDRGAARGTDGADGPDPNTGRLSGSGTGDIGEPVVPAKPPDGDADGVPDANDACPAEPGVATTDPKTHGCTLQSGAGERDSDADSIRDRSDACPAEPGSPSADPKKHGCPTSVRLDGSQIVILEQVHFKTASSEIDPSSFELLQQVADVLEAHPEIARLAVDGHTDDRGADASNLLLSRKRASAVVTWLTQHGVDARRTEARGFGARQPIADNTTDEGRAKNRRVEFLILRKTEEGAAGWREGTVQPNVEQRTGAGSEPP